MPDPNFSTSDAIWAKAAHIDISGCPQCACHVSMFRLSEVQRERHIATLTEQAQRILFLIAQRDRWKLLAFAGWFVVFAGLITRWWR